MAYPPKVDPIQKTWVIAIDFKLDRLKKYCLSQQGDDSEACSKMLNTYRVQIFNSFYEAVKPYGFDLRMQNSIVYNNSSDATKAFKAVSLGVKNSWIKYFIEKIHLFEIDPNSDASELLELNTGVENSPEWLTEELKEYLLTEEFSEE